MATLATVAATPVAHPRVTFAPQASLAQQTAPPPPPPNVNAAPAAALDPISAAEIAAFVAQAPISALDEEPPTAAAQDKVWQTSPGLTSA